MSDKKPALKSDKKVEDKKPVTTSFVNQNESIQLSTEVQMEEKEEKSIATKNVNDNKSAKVAVSKVQPKKVTFKCSSYLEVRILKVCIV